MREEEGGISFITHDNQIKALPRTKRLPPWKTKPIIPDDNYVSDHFPDNKFHFFRENSDL